MFQHICVVVCLDVCLLTLALKHTWWKTNRHPSHYWQREKGEARMERWQVEQNREIEERGRRAETGKEWRMKSGREEDQSRSWGAETQTLRDGIGRRPSAEAPANQLRHHKRGWLFTHGQWEGYTRKCDAFITIILVKILLLFSIAKAHFLKQFTIFSKLHTHRYNHLTSRSK